MMYVWEIGGFYADGYVIGVGTQKEVLEKLFNQDIERWKRLQVCNYHEYIEEFTDFVFALIKPDVLDAYREAIYANNLFPEYKAAVKKLTARELVSRNLHHFYTPEEELAFIRSKLVNGVSPWCLEPTIYEDNAVIVTDVCD
jgi:hypothetical protein